MEEPIKISIDRPCHEKFESFVPTRSGGFCHSCRKEVVDFSHMSRTEIVDYFKNSTRNTCGRFRVSQLEEFSPLPAPSISQSSFPAGVGLVGISLLSLLPLSGQPAPLQPPSSGLHQELDADNPEKVSTLNPTDSLVSGVVTDKLSGESIPFVNILLQDSTVGATTDFDGKFQFPVPLKKGDILTFTFVGYEKLKYTIGDELFLNIQLSEATSLGDVVIIMGAVSVAEPYSAQKSLWDKIKGLFK